MKYYISILFFLCIAGSINAQMIIDGDFEFQTDPAKKSSITGQIVLKFSKDDKQFIKRIFVLK